MKYDACIVGGGTAGSFAALSAARKGLDVIVVEKYGCLGGTSVHSLVTPSMPTYVEQSELYLEFESRLKEYEGEVYDKDYQLLRNEANVDRPNESTQVMYFSPISMQYVLEEMLIESGVTILYDAVLCDVKKNNGVIESIKVQTISGPMDIEAANFVDATGDGLLSEMSGIEMMCGNEGGENQFTSLRFEVANVNIDKLIDYLNNELGQTDCVATYPHYTFAVTHQGRNQVLEHLFKQALEDGVLTTEEYAWLQGFSMPSKPGAFSFNCPRIPTKVNISDPLVRSQNYTKGRQMIKKYVEFLRQYVPGFENCYLNIVATMLGVRESKRIVGKYVLTKDDYLERRKFSDGVVDSDWWIDIHKEIHDVSDEHLFDFKEYFEIPYRALITDDVENLIVCGRCISSDFLAQASIRIQPQCRMMGEVVGHALRYSKNRNIALNNIDGSKIREELTWKI